MTEPPTPPVTPNGPEASTPPPPPPGAPGTSPYGEAPPGTSPYGAAPPYGAPPGQPAPYAAGPYGGPAGPPRNGLGTAALVLGIVAIPGIFTVVLGILLGLLALIFGIIGRKRYSRREATNGGAAMAGAILGGVAPLGSINFLAPRGPVFPHPKSDIQKPRGCLNNAQTQQQQQDCQDQFRNNITN